MAGALLSSRFAELTSEFRQQHFLIGLVLFELASVFDLQYALSTNSPFRFAYILCSRNPGLHARAANLVRNLLTSHDFDSRYSNAACKARVAGLYLPFISVLLDALPHLYDWSSEGKGNRRLIMFGFYKRRNVKPNARELAEVSTSERKNNVDSPRG